MGISKRNIYTDKGGEDNIYLGGMSDISEIKENKDRLIKLRATNKPKFFKEYCLLYVDISQKGKITRQTAAYMLAGMMFVKELKAISAIDDIVMLAGELELPYRHATDGGDKQAYDAAWKELVIKINLLPY